MPVSETVGPSLTEAMNRLWTKFLPQMEERVANLHRAAENASKGTLGTEEQQRATSEAHKLAGVLGTFGLHAGTELAREAEVLYAGKLDRSVEVCARLAEIAEQLRVMIARRG